MQASLDVYQEKQSGDQPDGRILRHDCRTIVIPVSRRYRQITRRLEQIERQLERLAAMNAPELEFAVVGAPEDATMTTSIRPR